MKKGAKELTLAVAETQESCGDKDSRFCFLMIVAKDQEISSHKYELEQLAQKFSKDPIEFYYLFEDKIDIDPLFGAHVNKFPQYLLIKGKRKKYITYDDSIRSVKDLEVFIENMISGSGYYKNLLLNLANYMKSASQKTASGNSDL